MTELSPAESPARAPVRFSIIILTFARDPILAEVLKNLAALLGERTDYELILIDNNPEPAGREALGAAFAHFRYLRSGANKGVVARNDGFDTARGDYIVLLDDDVFVETLDFLDRFAAQFESDPKLGAITIRKHVRGDTRKRVDLIPHTRKSIDLTRPFFTFRFVGGCCAFRTQTIREIGGFLPDFFYGLEEIELSYRIIDAGWRILYDPAVSAEELEHPAGRRPKKDVQTDRLANKYKISYLRMPFPEILLNFILFTPYIFLSARGEVSVGGALCEFGRWWRMPGRRPRRPISRETAEYIRACGGTVWR